VSPRDVRSLFMAVSKSLLRFGGLANLMGDGLENEHSHW
jgi:hypothetical protein